MQDECSFVSLRDVKRAMEVMVWFYERYKQFSPLVRKREEIGEDNSESEEEDEEAATETERARESEGKLWEEAGAEPSQVQFFAYKLAI